MDHKYAKKRRRTLRPLSKSRCLACCSLAFLICCVAYLAVGRGSGSGGRRPPLQQDWTRRLRHLESLHGVADDVARRLLSAGTDTHEPRISSVVHSVMGRRAVVIDKAIPEKERKRIADQYIKLTGSSSQQGWHREKASDLSLDHNAMGKDMTWDECDGVSMSIIRSLLPHFYDQCDPFKPVWVTRCSIYAQTFIDIDEVHQDRNHDEKAFSVTAIWYPNERWHAGWGGETVFLSSESSDADLLLPILPKPSRLLLFDSEIPHMAKPATPIAEPFRPAAVSHVMLPSTRTNGNRYSFVIRTMCSTLTVEELVEKFGDGAKTLTRSQLAKLLDYLEIDHVNGALARLSRIASNQRSYTVDHLRTFFDLKSSAASAASRGFVNLTAN